LLLLEDLANNHQWRRVFALVSLVISLSSQPAEAPSSRQGGRTIAPPKQPMRWPLGTALTTRDSTPRELAWERLFRVFILCRSQMVNKSLYSSLA